MSFTKTQCESIAAARKGGDGYSGEKFYLNLVVVVVIVLPEKNDGIVILNNSESFQMLGAITFTGIIKILLRCQDIATLFADRFFLQTYTFSVVFFFFFY